jgi:1-acyl-sn-glycerol-3-phosphate acyltransferase
MKLRWLVDLPVTAIAWTWLGLVLVVFDPLTRLARLGGPATLEATVTFMCRLLSLCFPLTFSRLVVEGRQNAPRHGRLIIVANHQSLAETFLPLWVLADLRPKFISKKELARGIPTVSFNLRVGGHCLIDRQDREQAVAAIRELGQRVAAGEVSALIFPEGTRAADGLKIPFKRAGLTTLLQAAPRAPVLPIVFDGGARLFPRRPRLMRAGSTVRMRILPPIERQGQDEETLIRQVEGLIAEELARLRGEVPAGVS